MDCGASHYKMDPVFFVKYAELRQHHGVEHAHPARCTDHSDRKNPSVFEPVHGSAFDIMGKGIANPIGAIWAAADMLAWLGEQESADAIMGAIERVCKEEKVTADMGGELNTKQAAAAICEALSATK
ncbi:uncharacterized protein B0I36DRAFT_367296 [Microdochium trichocladiopsis]|uniref:Isopropylmalate dehydrogenase-like domain-containing protein n=1 Tax=Microdochium trichocladiopsis TaxID=1682393 RepID=A0A9P8XVQ3_9PEZI|nr:uncharacterized protein B0I36DRAFT_367296 [Microdochium trichocladiopsis]KAH7020811.1 hypothetical protein B0I36DRAFT_367296 [Microdochium trichocladiopsis]